MTRSSDLFEPLMAYFHVDRTRAYVDSLGLSRTLRAKPQKVRANGITVVEAAGSHALYVSRPEPVAELIETAIKEIS